MEKIRLIFRRLRKIDANDIFNVISISITIAAFFAVVEYFTMKQSIAVSFGQLSGNIIKDLVSVGYYADNILKFYEEGELIIPDIFNNDPNLKGFFKDSTPKLNKNYTSELDTASDDKIIKALTAGQNFGAYLDKRIDLLEKQLDKYEYDKKVYGAVLTGRGHYSEENFKKVLGYISPKLTKDDYFTFLSASIRSREFNNWLLIKNDGDVDLIDVKIIVSSPLSKVTEKRENNILSFSMVGPILNKAYIDGDSLICEIPELKKNQTLSYSIYTREHILTDNNIIYKKYEADKKIDVTKTWIITMLIFFIIVAFKLFFKGSDVSNKQSLLSATRR